MHCLTQVRPLHDSQSIANMGSTVVSPPSASFPAAQISVHREPVLSDGADFLRHVLFGQREMQSIPIFFSAFSFLYWWKFVYVLIHLHIFTALHANHSELYLTELLLGFETRTTCGHLPGLWFLSWETLDGLHQVTSYSEGLWSKVWYWDTKGKLPSSFFHQLWTRFSLTALM